jgi:hypothetical protein
MAAKRGLDGDGHDVHVTAVRHPQALEGLNVQRGVPRPDEGGLLADVARAEARPRAVGAAAVEGHAVEGHIQALGPRPDTAAA